MLETSGTFALITRGSKTVDARVGPLGSLRLRRGWYAHIGSTCRLNTVVQYETPRCDTGWPPEQARTHEIWFTLDAANRKSDWAEIVGTLPGGTCLNPDFGSHDCKCRLSYLVRFNEFPILALFRQRLASQFVDHDPVFVKYVAKSNRKATAGISGLKLQCEIGRRFLETRRFRALERGRDAVSAFREGVVELRNETNARELRNDLANQFSISIKAMTKNIQLADAVDRIVNTCGDSALRAIFATRQKSDSVIRLARTADTRQRHRIDCVLSGRARSVRPQNNDLVFDTVAFGEVVSRLGRARGAIQKLTSLPEAESDRETCEECVRLAELCSQATTGLLQFIDADFVGTDDVPHGLNKATLWPLLSSRVISGQHVGQLRLVLRLTVKNVWDFPRCRRGDYCLPIANVNGVARKSD